MAFFTIIDNKSSEELGLIARLPDISPGARQYRVTPIVGKNGDLIEDLKTYSDTIIKQEFEFVEYDINNWNNVFRQCKKWLYNIKEKVLKFSDDLSTFYILKSITIDTPSREAVLNGKFTVQFTCDPFTYFEDGKIEIELTDNIYNYFDETRPIYRIEGEGLLTIKVNGVEVEANIGQNLIINTIKGMCYREDGSKNNTALTGYYSDLYLKEGYNTFEYDREKFNISIIPNWRCI